MNKEMKMLTNGLITQKYTKVMKETEYQYNAPHLYTVINKENEDELCKIHFQEGPIKDCGVNGVAIEDLIAMCIDRLEHFQNSKFNCRENEMAITKLQESLMWLRKRTLDREAKGIEGTNVVDSVEDALSQNPLYKELNTYQKEQLDNFIKENSITREQVLLQKNISGPVYTIQVVNLNDMERKTTLYRYRLDDIITEDSIEQSTSENSIFQELNAYQLEQLDMFMKRYSVDKDGIIFYRDPSTMITTVITKNRLERAILYKDKEEVENDSLSQNPLYKKLNNFQLEQLEDFIKNYHISREDISLSEDYKDGFGLVNASVNKMRFKKSILLYKDIKELDEVSEGSIHPIEKDLLIQKQIYSRLNAYKKQKLDKFIKSRSLNKEDIYLFENPIKGRIIAVDRHRVNTSWILL